ncbi:MAG: acyl-CoA dehydrogenase, partial [Wenzhouxiangellaceae bacterium]
MMLLFFIFALLAVSLVCSFLKTSLAVWTAAMAASLVAFTVAGEPGPISLTLGWLLFAAIAVPLNYLPWRQTFITAPVLKIFAKMTPQISETERVALEAGTVSFEGELFTGRPNWRKLINKPLPELTLEEQA